MLLWGSASAGPALRFFRWTPRALGVDAGTEALAELLLGAASSGGLVYRSQSDRVRHGDVLGVELETGQPLHVYALSVFGAEVEPQWFAPMPIVIRYPSSSENRSSRHLCRVDSGTATWWGSPRAAPVIGFSPSGAPSTVDQDLTRTAELIRSAQGGDSEALNRLIARYYERVRRIVILRLGPRLRQRIETSDILQETFIAAMRTFDQFEMRDEGAFIHWLSRIAEHQIRDAADYHKALKRDTSREISLSFEDSSGDTVGIDPAASGLLPVEALSRVEQDAIVDRCLTQMPEQYRELIILRDYEGLSWDDVARETGRPSPDAARMQHATAMVDLAKRVRSSSAS